MISQESQKTLDGVSQKMKLYLDTCCWCRPCDDHADKDVYNEAVAIMRIIRRARRKGFTILGSVVLEDEINENPDVELLVWITNLYSGTITAEADYNSTVFKFLGQQAKVAGVTGWDIYHLCHAESSRADYLLTVDKKFLKAAARLNTNVKVINPLNFPLGGII